MSDASHAREPVDVGEHSEVEKLLQEDSRFHASESLIAGLLREGAKDDDAAERAIKRRARMLETLRLETLRDTSPSMWTCYPGKNGAPNVYAPRKTAGEIIRQHYEIELIPGTDGPNGPDGEPTTAMTAEFEANRAGRGGVAHKRWGEYISRAIGVRKRIIFARRDDEDFLGRQHPKAAPSGKPMLIDILTSVIRGLDTQAARELSGLSKVSAEELERAWEGDDTKRVEDIPVGSGGGSGAERQAENVAEDGVVEAAGKLGEELLRRTDGDQQAAEQLLVEITKTDKFKGRKSCKTFTQHWQIDKAWEALKKHEIFGDQNAEG